MGEVVPLFKGAEVIQFPLQRQLDVGTVAIRNTVPEPKVEIPGGIVHALDKLIHRGRIDEAQACELLDDYLENGNTEFILTMQDDIAPPVEQDPNQLSLFD